MKRALTPYHLGATLYLPATHKNLEAVLCKNKYPKVKSVIVDFEDAILEEELDSATLNFQELLLALADNDIIIFVRARSLCHFKDLLRLECINKIDGFVLAKCDTTNMKLYFSMLVKHEFWLMPVLEPKEVFDTDKLLQMRDYFVENKERILSLRFGGEDLSSSLGLKRQCTDILYDFYPMVHLLSSVVLMFKPLGFNITAAVFTCFKNTDGLKNEVKEDLKMGLFGKTVIHPSQVALVHELYKVKKDEFSQAVKVIEEDADAIISHEGMMLETVPHRRWAKVVSLRESHYGLS